MLIGYLLPSLPKKDSFIHLIFKRKTKIINCEYHKRAYEHSPYNLTYFLNYNFFFVFSYLRKIANLKKKKKKHLLTEKDTYFNYDDLSSTL